MSKLPRLLPLIAVAIGGVVATRAISSVQELPDLFSGTARAETAAPAANAAATTAAAGQASAARTPRPAPAAICTPSAAELARQAGLSPAELRVLQSLGVRRGQLDAREQALSTQVALLEAASRKLEDRTRTLQQARAQLQGLLGQADTQTQGEVNRLVAVYSNMRPREAAAIFNQLDDSVRLPVAAAMRPQKLAAIMAQMPPQAARELTERLARRFAGAQAVVQQARAAMAQPAAATPAPSAAAPATTANASGNAPAVAPAPRPAAPAETRPATTQPQAAAPPSARPPRRQPRPQARTDRPRPRNTPPAAVAAAPPTAPPVTAATPPRAQPTAPTQVAAGPRPPSQPAVQQARPATPAPARTSGPAA